MSITYHETFSMLADVLFDDGPLSVKELEKRAYRGRVKWAVLAKAAERLGVEEFERDGQKFWRLPSNVVPFLRYGRSAA
jgi:hypothetical protein